MKKLITTLVLTVAFTTFLNAQNTLNNINLTSSTPASVAYSLRLLSSSYAGPLVRIKVGTSSFYDVYPDASNKFSLTSKISAAVSTFNAAAASAGVNALSTIITGSTDATIAVWYDQSGYGIHVFSTAATTATAKIISQGTIYTINGQPTIFFNSTGYLVSSSTVDYSSQVGATVNAIVQNVATTSNVGGIIGTAYQYDQPGYGIAASATNIDEGYFSDGNGAGWYTGVLTTNPKILTDIFLNNTTTNSSFYVNGVLKSTTRSNGTAPIYPKSGSRIYIGRARGYNSFDFNGYISEAFIFPKKINDTEKSAIETSQAIFVPQPPSITITSSASGAVCSGTNVTFTSNVYNFTSTPTYQWYKNGTLINGETNANYTTSTLANADQIYVTATQAYTSNTIISTVNASPATPIITVVGDGCLNKTSFTTPTGLTSYAWYKDNLAISSATSNAYIPSASGSYQVIVSNGTCSSTSAATTINTCARNANGKMTVLSSSTTLVSAEGAINIGKGVDQNGKLLVKP